MENDLSFYTCVNRFGNSILVRGYTAEGKPFTRRVKYKPTLYLPSQNPTTEYSYGKLSDFRIYDYVHSQEEIINTYNEALRDL